jgi:hypothetical protein
MTGLILDAVMQPGPSPLRVGFSAARNGYPVLPVPVTLLACRSPAVAGAAGESIVDPVVGIDGNVLPVARVIDEQREFDRAGIAYCAIASVREDAAVRWDIRVVRGRGPTADWNWPWTPYTITVAHGPSVIRVPIVCRVRPSEVFFEGGDFAERGLLNSKAPLSIITRNVVMQGWLLEDAGPTPDAQQIEDAHWNLSRSGVYRRCVSRPRPPASKSGWRVTAGKPAAQ